MYHNSLKSLLWIQENRQGSFFSNDQQKVIARDIGIKKVTDLMSKEPHFKVTPDTLLKFITPYKNDIVYRKEIITEIEKNPKAISIIEDTIIRLNEMEELHKGLPEGLLVKRILLRIKKLNTYVKVVKNLKDLFEEAYKTSSNVRNFYTFVNEKYISEKIDDLIQDLKEIDEILAKYKSIRIGANIDAQFSIKEAIVLAVDDKKYDKDFLIDKIVKENQDEFDFTPLAGGNSVLNMNDTRVIARGIYKDLKRILKPELKHIQQVIDKYKEIITSRIIVYKDELLFYSGALRLMKLLNEYNLPYSFPEITNGETILSNLYSLHVACALKVENESEEDYKIVFNDVEINKQHNIVIITGPNSGGKTTFIQSMALVQILFQCGMIVPAESSKLKLYNKIFTHYPKNEDIEKGTGRLGEEAKRISDIVSHSDDNSLIYLNEPYVTTSPEEGLKILELTINKLKNLKRKVFLVTHYLSIVDYLKDNGEVASFTMGIENGVRTYKVKKEKPLGLSFARDIANAYDINFESIIKTFKNRQVIKLNKEVDIIKIHNSEGVS